FQVDSEPNERMYCWPRRATPPFDSDADCQTDPEHNKVRPEERWLQLLDRLQRNGPGFLRSAGSPFLNHVANLRTDFRYCRALDGRNKAVPHSANCLDIPWGVRRVAHHLSQPGSRGIQPAVVVDESALGPDPPDQDLSQAHFTRCLKQAEKEFKWLILQPHS